MQAIAHFSWTDGTTVEIPCNWNDDGSIAEGTGIGQRIYLSDEFARAWDSEPLRFIVRSVEDPRLEREIEFDATRAAIHTQPLRLRKRSACSTPTTR